MSPRLTAYSVCNLSTKLRKRACFIWPMGRRTARTRAGATGDNWSSILRPSGMQLAQLSSEGNANRALWVSWAIHGCFERLTVRAARLWGAHKEWCRNIVGPQLGHKVRVRACKIRACSHSCMERPYTPPPYTAPYTSIHCDYVATVWTAHTVSFSQHTLVLFNISIPLTCPLP
jgi:hypothetical protein